MISEVEPNFESNISALVQKAIHFDVQPIRTACFSPNGDYFALGTNSKCLKICSLPKLNSDDEEGDNAYERSDEEINVVFEQMNHHQGSIYCIDWSRTGRLIATGSNDKTIKLLVCPDFNNDQSSDILELQLEGHQAIVRTVCFNPSNDLNLLSGGHLDPDLKVWDSETGMQVASLSGHEGSINSVKMS